MTPDLSRTVFVTSEVPPPHHFSDWGAWSWGGWLIGTVVLFAIAAVALYWFAGLQPLNTYAEIDWFSVGLGAAAFVATIAGLIVHGNVARHIAGSGSDRLWLAVPLLVAAVFALISSQIRGGTQRSWVGWAATGIVVLGGIGNAITDSLNRVAANIPMSVKSLGLLVVVTLVALIVYGTSQRSRRY